MSRGGDMDSRLLGALLAREREVLAGRLLQGLTHNLAGTLQMIRLPLDLVEAYLGQGKIDRATGKMAEVQAAFNQAEGLMQYLAAYSANLARTKPRDYDLGQLAREHLNFWLADMFFKHEVTLTTEIALGHARVHARYADVALALSALIRNSLDSLMACGKRGLSLRLLLEGERAGILVADEGPGLDPDWSERAFLPHESQKDPSHQGLGLFLAQEAVRPWGGELVWRAGPEKGFLLSLPLAES